MEANKKAFQKAITNVSHGWAGHTGRLVSPCNNYQKINNLEPNNSRSA